MTGGHVAVVGAGSIGVAWAVVFARAGMQVRLHDPDGQRLHESRADLQDRLAGLVANDLLDETPDAVAARVLPFERLAGALAGARHVQENAPEDVTLKRALFVELDAGASPEATIASSSSAIVASVIAGDLAGRERCLVVHPGNPPYLLPVAEIVPAPFTSERAVERVEELLRAAGMSPVRVRSEVEGFVFNRLQGALLREAYCLVRDGVVSADDVDRVVRDGLGRRWSVIGPFATAELNTRGGIRAHAERLGPAYARMGAERGQHDPWTPELVEQVAAQVHQSLPPERWEENVRRRDRALMVLERARRGSDLFARDAETTVG